MAETRTPRFPATDTMPDQARETRARAWTFVMDSYAIKKAAPTSRQNDVKEVSNDSRRNVSIQQR